MEKDNKKQGFFGRLGSYVGLGKSVKEDPKILKKGFNIARNNRLNNSFNVSRSDINSDVYTDGYRLMTIARDYEKNNPFARKYLNLMVANVVGSVGFTLFVRVLIINQKQLTVKHNINKLLMNMLIKLFKIVFGIGLKKVIVMLLVF